MGIFNLKSVKKIHYQLDIQWRTEEKVLEVKVPLRRQNKSISM